MFSRAAAVIGKNARAGLANPNSAAAINRTLSSFSLSTAQTNKLAWVAGSAALAVTGHCMADEDKVDVFMQSYGNRVFMACMANQSFRDAEHALRDAELLYHGISFEKNEHRAVFYRGMTMPNHLDASKPEHVQQWQASIIESVRGPGLSPLLWLTRPSATRASGFNLHPHDGSAARALGDVMPPASWSAAVMAMTCSIEVVKGYSSLDRPNHKDAGCIILAAPRRLRYLSSTDIKSRNEVNVAHESEVITPRIENSETLAIIFVEHGVISRVEINNLQAEYTIDDRLVDELTKAYAKASPEAQPKLMQLITTLGRQKRLDLVNEFDKRFNLNEYELIATTRKIIQACNDEIDQLPGLLGMELRRLRKEHDLLEPQEVAKLLGVEPSVQEEFLSTQKIS